MASRTVVAKRYARALLQMAKTPSDAAKWLEPLAAFSRAVETSSDLSKLLKSPAFAESDKEAVVLELAKKTGASSELEQFYRVLVSAQRIGAIVEISNTFKQMLLDTQNTVEAEIETATEMTPAQIGKIQEMLEKTLGKKVIAKTRIEPSILAGFRVSVAGMTLDASLKANIDTIHKNLLRADFARKGVRAEA